MKLSSDNDLPQTFESEDDIPEDEQAVEEIALDKYKALDVLPDKIQMAVIECTSKAYASSTIKNSNSAWKPWCQYMTDCGRSPYLHSDDPHYRVFLTGFKASLATGLYANLTTASSVTAYYNQIITILTSQDIVKINRAVGRGMQKELADNKRFQEPFLLSYYGTMYERLDTQDLRQVRNLLAYSFLGFSLSRSQLSVLRQYHNGGRDNNH